MFKKSILSGAVFFLFSVCTRAIDKDTNIIISSVKAYYEFILDHKTNLPRVKQKVTTTYYCNTFRTTLPVIEMYSDETSIDNIDFYVDGKRPKDIKPVYSYYSVDDIFYSDARICYFPLPLEKKGSTSEVSFEKTTLDPKYFPTIFFSELYPVRTAQITIKIPRWMKVEIKEMNFANYSITKTTQYTSGDDADIVTYTASDLPAMHSERNSPGPTYIYPHLLVLAKSATVNGGNITYFNTVADQYAWYRQLVSSIDNNKEILQQKAGEITQGLANDADKIKAVFYWVQNNIRYIAFEDGIAGFRPEKADEVLRKKYGDCKGMANLTKELLKSLGYDARLCWIGTNHIAYDYSTPSVAVDNHMICALMYQNKTYFLDATETYLAFNEYAERIEGRQVLVEDGDKFVLTRVPSTTYGQNLDREKRSLSITGNDLQGSAEHEWKGEEEEFLLTQLNSTKKDKSKEAFNDYLSNDNKDYIITNLVTSDIRNYDKELTAKYDVVHKNAVSSFSGDYYIDPDFRKEFSGFTIDTAERNFDFWFYYKANIERETELIIPSGYKVSSVPPNLEISNNDYVFSIQYIQQPGRIVYKKSIIIKNPYLSKSTFTQWNNDIEKLTNAYNEQLVFTRK